MIDPRAANAATSNFAYARFRDNDLQYVYAALETAIKVVGAVADNVWLPPPTSMVRTTLARDTAAAAVFEVSSVLNGLKVPAEKGSEAIGDHRDAEEGGDETVDEVESTRACGPSQDSPACDQIQEVAFKPFHNHLIEIKARLLNAQAAILELQVEWRECPLDNGTAIDLGEGRGWLNLIGDVETVDWAVEKIRAGSGVLDDSERFALVRNLQEALRGLSCAKRDAIMVAITAVVGAN